LKICERREGDDDETCASSGGIQGGGIFAKVEFVRYCVEYLYSPITMGLELYLAV
jgi:hypothetical protein